MKFRPFAFILVSASAFAAQLEYRTWTDTQQRRIEATLESQSGDNVTLRTRDGKALTVPVSTLSEADRQWLRERGDAEGGEAAGAPQAAATWPRSVSLKGPPVVRTVKEDAAAREFVYETDHYEFVSDSKIGAALVREFARVFEATWLVNVTLPLDFQPRPESGRSRFRARIFTHEEDYLKAGGVPGSAGVYMPGAAALMLPLKSLGVQMVGSRVAIDYQREDYETLVHEITHQMMNHWLDRLPVWFIEGSAEYVELAEYDGGKFTFLRHPARLAQHIARMSSGPFVMQPLRWLMQVGHREWTANLGPAGEAWRNYASALLLTYFFYHLDGDGKGTHMIAFLRAVEDLPRGADPTPLIEKHLLRGRDYAALQEELRRAYRREQINVVFPEM